MFSDDDYQSEDDNSYQYNDDYHDKHNYSPTDFIDYNEDDHHSNTYESEKVYSHTNNNYEENDEEYNEEYNEDEEVTKYVTEEYDINGRVGTYVSEWDMSLSCAKRRQKIIKMIGNVMNFNSESPVMVQSLRYMDFLYLKKKTQGHDFGLLAAGCFSIACCLHVPPIHLFRFELENTMRENNCIVIRRSKKKNQSNVNNMKSSIAKIKKFLIGELLDSGKIEISDLEKITNQSWEKLFDRAVYQSGGEIFGGGVDGMIRKIGYELIRFVELVKFSVGCQHHGIIASILIESKQLCEVLGHTSITNKNIFKFFKPGIRKFTIMDKVRKLHVLIANKMKQKIPYNPHDYFDKLEFINNEMESEQNRQNFAQQGSLFDVSIPPIHLGQVKSWKSEPLDISIFDGDNLGNYIKSEFLPPPQKNIITTTAIPLVEKRRHPQQQLQVTEQEQNEKQPKKRIKLKIYLSNTKCTDGKLLMCPDSAVVTENKVLLKNPHPQIKLRN